MYKLPSRMSTHNVEKLLQSAKRIERFVGGLLKFTLVAK